MRAPSDRDIDALILLFAREQWRKVAMIISIVLDESGRRAIDVDEHAVAERIRALVDQGQLEVQGNLSDWRHSEVKLPE